MLTSVIFLGLGGLATADLRLASLPKEGWKLRQKNHEVPFRHPAFPLYMEPSDFKYDGLKKQRARNYDNFLRSNIDNEQDNRNFDTEDGKDHLPFRSYETAANDADQGTVETKMKPADPKNNTGVTEAGNYIEVTESEPYVVPLRWNNPHAVELEVNIWIMNKGSQKYVVPVMKPTCSGEGYQDNVFDFKVPKGFPTNVCNNVGDCVLQVYAHSVESRMYASGTPVIVKGATGTWNAASAKEPEKDLAFDLHKLRPLCLSRADPTAHHISAVLYKARLSSDQYNHAYQNSDFSPYAGQQPQHISQNLQAACILKMTANNFGELGKEYMQKTAHQARDYAHKLDKKARYLIVEYEKAADNIIDAIKGNVANEDTFPISTLQEEDVVRCNTSWIRGQDGKLVPFDKTLGYCAKGLTCLCYQDCNGPRDNSQRRRGRTQPEKLDAYCAKMTNTSEDQATFEAGSEQERIFLYQETETCFRCKDVGSTTTRRHNTNTYIPSFEFNGKENVNMALDFVTGRQLSSGFLQNPASGTISAMDDESATLSIYMAVLTEMWGEFKIASDGTYAAYKCPAGKESVSEASCLEEAKKLIPAGRGQGRTTLVSGSWGHVPTGCSIQSGGDWAAHYNKDACGQNSGDYTLVCQVAEQAQNETEQDQPATGCPAGNESVSEASCLEDAKKLIPAGKEQRRKTLITGHWSHVPVGCSMYTGDWAAHYNKRHCGNNHAQFLPICQVASQEQKDPLEKFKFTYRGPVLKTTTDTLSDANGGINRNYRKRDAEDKNDRGYYSAAKAWPLQNRINGSSTPVPDRDGPLAQTRMYGQTLKYPPLAPAAVGCNSSGASLMEDEDMNLAIGKLRTLSKEKRAAVLAAIEAEPRAPRPGLMRTRSLQNLSPGE